MDVFELTAKIALDTKDYESGLTGAQKKSTTFSQKLKSGLTKAAKTGAVAVGALATAAGAATAALVKGIGETATYGDNIDKMSQKLGMTSDAYQEWDFIMQHCGTSIDSMQAGMKTLASAAETGNKAFEKLGMSQEEIANMSQEELFSATITALQNVSDETERTYLAGQLLGRGATELGALLNTSAEDTEAMRQAVHDLGGVMSEDAVKAAAAYKDSLQNMQTSIGGVKNSIMSEFMPSVTTIMDGISAIFSGDPETGIGLIQSGVSDFASTLTEVVPKVLEAVGQIMSGILAGILEGHPQLQEAWDSISGLFTAAWDAIKLVWDAVAPYFQNIWNIIKSVFAVVEAVLSGDFSGAWDAIKGVWDAVVGYYRQLWEDIKSVFSVVADVLGGFFSDAWDAVSEAWDGVTGYFSEKWESIKKTLSPVAETIGGFFSDAWKNVKSTVEGWPDYFREKWEDIKKKFSDAIETIKGYFKFDWSFPKLKLPHLSVTGKFSLSPPSVPHFSIQWYRKAMDNAMLLNDATIFGAAGGKLLGGGEAGPEVVSGADTLMKMIRNAVRQPEQSEPITIVVQSVLDGRVIGESTYRYLRNREVAYG